MSSKYLQQIELLIFGYIRSIPIDIPKEINFICLKYYPKIEIIFDISSKEGMKFVSTDGLTLDIHQKQDYFTFASSVGWNKGMYMYRI